MHRKILGISLVILAFGTAMLFFGALGYEHAKNDKAMAESINNEGFNFFHIDISSYEKQMAEYWQIEVYGVVAMCIGTPLLVIGILLNDKHDKIEEKKDNN